MVFKVCHCKNIVFYIGFNVCHCKNVVFHMVLRFVIAKTLYFTMVFKAWPHKPLYFTVVLKAWALWGSLGLSGALWCSLGLPGALVAICCRCALFVLVGAGWKADYVAICCASALFAAFGRMLESIFCRYLLCFRSLCFFWAETGKHILSLLDRKSVV